jgi:hypothetical protein
MVDHVPLQTLQAIAARVEESIDSSAAKTDWSSTAPNSILVCNVLNLLLKRQRQRRSNAPGFKHRVSWSANQPLIRLEVFPLLTVDTDDIDALRSLSSRVRSLRFVFERSGQPLAYGQITLELVDARLAHAPPPLPLYAPPGLHNRRIFDVDWSESVVLKPDRALVLRVIDSVHNMHETMPADIRVSIEPIEAANYEQRARSKKRKQSAAADAVVDESSDATSVAHGQLVGYCLHFVNVPSFNDSFLDHLAAAYDGRFIGAAVLFPQKRGKDVLLEQQLSVSVSADHTLVQQAKPHALRGAKRLCRKVFREDAADE